MIDPPDLGNLENVDNEEAAVDDGVVFANDPGILSDPFDTIGFPAATSAGVWNPWDDHSMEELRQELLPTKGR